MCAAVVDQITSDGELIQDIDTRLTPTGRDALILSYLPGARVQKIAGQNVIVYKDIALLRKQVTHLGNPWPGFKKRIQIPKKWLTQFDKLASEALQPKFIGVYSYGDTCIFVDFEPTKYLARKANNSAAHVATNDLYQAQVHGTFERTDRNGNLLKAVRADRFEKYLTHGGFDADPRIEVFKEFNKILLNNEIIDSLPAITEMHSANWPDTFQSEWAGFYLEFCIDRFLKECPDPQGIELIKAKTKGTYDFDLRFSGPSGTEFFGDLKASDRKNTVAPGNDGAEIERCLQDYGKFWYVIYEHETFHAKNNADLATIQWNRWKDSVGYFENRGKPYKELSYASRFKEAVQFSRMMILEINPANKHLVLGEFAQGRQPDGAQRALKVMIRKTNVDNFLVFTAQGEGQISLAD